MTEKTKTKKKKNYHGKELLTEAFSPEITVVLKLQKFYLKRENPCLKNNS